MTSVINQNLPLNFGICHRKVLKNVELVIGGNIKVILNEIRTIIVQIRQFMKMFDFQDFLLSTHT